MKQDKKTGFKVKTQVQAGLISGGGGGLTPGTCQCINGEKWCMLANGALRDMGPCFGV